VKPTAFGIARRERPEGRGRPAGLTKSENYVIVVPIEWIRSRDILPPRRDQIQRKGDYAEIEKVSVFGA
jgi:hypothetical protein